MSSTAEVQPFEPQSLIREAHLKATLKTDKGTEAQFTSWTAEDFTQKGNSIKVEYLLDGKENNVSCVVKVNQKRPTSVVGMNVVL